MKKPRKNLFTYSPNHFFTKKGFTLAEVLITLGIIGVVAAITIPTLIANANALKFRSQFKKSISTLSQAVRLNQAKYDFNFADINVPLYSHSKEEVAAMSADKDTSMAAILNSNLSGYTYFHWEDFSLYKNVTMVSVGASTFHETMAYQLADGSIFLISPDPENCHLKIGDTLANGDFGDNCYGYIDVNGISGPNKEVSCSGDIPTKLIGDEDYQECVVKNDAKHMTDIYPVYYHDSIVEPATNAAKYVLNSAK